jgi:hypothetical protein
MLYKLLLISLFLSGCFTGQDFSYERYMESLIGTEFKEYAEKYFTYYTRRTVTRKDKPWLMNETFRWTETLNQKQPNGTHIYKYANPFSNCKITLLVNQEGIVINDYSQGDDCDA